MSFKVYLDENMPRFIADALRNRGTDVKTTQEAGNLGITDSEQLEYAAKHGRVLVTFNKRDFAILHKEYLALNKKHAGILLATQLDRHLLLKRLLQFLSENSADGMTNKIHFLGSSE